MLKRAPVPDVADLRDASILSYFGTVGTVTFVDGSHFYHDESLREDMERFNQT